MTNDAVPVTGAIEALVAALEREHDWLAELRADATRAERTCQRLLTAIEAALDTLSPAERRPFLVRVVRMRNETKPLGRPPRDPRRNAVLDFLAERGGDTVTSAECRAHLSRLGLSADSSYLGRLMATLATAGAVTRTGMGRYAVNATHPTLQWVRLRAAHAAAREATGGGEG